jgi:predicted patatin/cPLA2 family phospholipase
LKNFETYFAISQIYNYGKIVKIGLALGGDGTRGSANIGVLKVLKRRNIPIDLIVETSIGALVGYGENIIAKVLGHSDNKTTRHYTRYASFLFFVTVLLPFVSKMVFSSLENTS